MITQRFVFFCSLLGFVILNAVTGSALIVTTPIILGLIWMVSGVRYVIYGIAVYLFFAIPSLVRVISTLPVMLQAETQLPSLLLHSQVSLSLPPMILFYIGFLPLVFLGTLYTASIAKWEMNRLFGKRIKKI